MPKRVDGGWRSRCRACGTKDEMYLLTSSRCGMCLGCWREYQRQRYAARRISRGLPYERRGPRGTSAALVLQAAMGAPR